MAKHTTYTNARANLAKLCSQVSENKEVVYIKRRDAENVALIAESELSSLLETVHLMRSPKNARRLLDALDQALAEKGRVMTIDDLKEEVGID